jgi:hypothetical protein
MRSSATRALSARAAATASSRVCGTRKRSAGAASAPRAVGDRAEIGGLAHAELAARLQQEGGGARLLGTHLRKVADGAVARGQQAVRDSGKAAERLHVGFAQLHDLAVAHDRGMRAAGVQQHALLGLQKLRARAQHQRLSGAQAGRRLSIVQGLGQRKVEGSDALAEIRPRLVAPGATFPVAAARCA